jgi:hypothetical protein
MPQPYRQKWPPLHVSARTEAVRGRLALGRGSVFTILAVLPRPRFGGIISSSSTTTEVIVSPIFFSPGSKRNFKQVPYHNLTYCQGFRIIEWPVTGWRKESTWKIDKIVAVHQLLSRAGQRHIRRTILHVGLVLDLGVQQMICMTFSSHKLPLTLQPSSFWVGSFLGC